MIPKRPMFKAEGVRGKMVRVRISEAEWSPDLGSYVVYLNEIGGRRVYPLFVRELEAQLIGLLVGTTSEAPYRTPHDLSALLAKLKVRVIKVKLTKSLFFDVVGKIVCLHGKKTRVFTSSAAGAVELALRCDVPIYVENRLFLDYGQESSDRTNEIDELEELKADLQRAIKFEEYEQAAKLRDRIARLEKRSDCT